MVWRDGRQFHVYGAKGADHTVVEVGKKAGTTTTDATATDTTSAATTTPTSSDSTSAKKS